MTKTNEREEFVCVMTQEYPSRSDLLPILQELMRLARRHCRLQERACNQEVPDGHDAQCESRIRDLCNQLPGCVPVFSGDPRGATVKLKLPSGRTNDWGGTGICVPQ